MCRTEKNHKETIWGSRGMRRGKAKMKALDNLME